VTLADSRIDELRRRLERDPGSRLFAQLAEEHRKAGEHAEAIRVARAGLALHPSYPSARLTLGRALLDSGDAGGARVELEAALRDAPDNILASRFLGQALEALGELGPALAQLQATLKMAPGDRQLESQILSLQTRLRSPQAPPALQVSLAAPRGIAPTPSPPRPRRAVAPPPGEDDEEAGGLPPTIRIHMPADRVPRAQAPPVPPPLPPTAAPPAPAQTSAPPRAEARIERPVPVSAAAAPGSSTLPAIAPRMSTEPFYESDVAPTLPTAYAPGIGAADESSAPTLPPGAVAAEETVFEAEAPPEPVDVPRAAPPPPSAADPTGSGQGATPFSSSTLAELYFRQGLVERAVEVYRQVLDEEPGNEKARARLAELVSAHHPPDARAARRAGLERTIAGLEALLVVLRRR
jgi:tetratricopeptide (TPR) repeat protein